MTMFTGCIRARLLWFKLGMAGRQNHGSPKISKSKSLEHYLRGQEGEPVAVIMAAGGLLGMMLR